MQCYEEYAIQTTAGAPGVRFLYISGPHSVNAWRREQDLKTCKINLFIEGYSHIIVNGRAYAVNAGDVLLYRPHELHFGQIPYEQQIEYFEMQFEPAAFSALCGAEYLERRFLRADSSQALPTLFQPDKARFERIKRRLCALRDRAAAGAEPLWQLALTLETLAEIGAAGDGSTAVSADGFYPLPLVRALDYIHAHRHERIDNADMAAAAAVSASYLSRIFRNYLRCTPHDYLLSCRLNEACAALAAGASVTEACYAAGFEDISSFGAIFRRRIGVLPSAYCRAPKSL